MNITILFINVRFYFKKIKFNGILMFIFLDNSLPYFMKHLIICL